MKKKILLPFLFGFLIINSNTAQSIDFEQFRSLRSAGTVPEDFTKLSSEKFQEDRENISTGSSSERRDQETFLLESNFLMDDILHSGRVIFGDPVTNYLNELKDIIFEDNAETRESIRIYTLLSNEVNAFTSDNGIVLVSTGLLAQVENEAQIVFILCHEFNHYIKKHAINNYVENQRIERGSGIYRSLGAGEVDLEKFRYSKELESEADDLGLYLFKKTNYSIAEAQGVFDVLLYSYLPFDEVEFDTTFFDDESYNFPQQYFTDTVSTITAEEDYDDEESTHPNIKKRRDAMLIAAKKIKEEGRQTFIVGEEKFRYIQKLCRYQGCEIYLSDIEYEDAIYQAYLLLLEDSTNQYLKNVITQALYGLSMYHNADATPDWHRYYKKVEGNSQQVFYFMYKIPEYDLNILALKHAWESHLANPENKQMNDICVQLAKELVTKNDALLSSFYDEQRIKTLEVKSKIEENDTITTEKIEEPKIEKVKTKYDKIKKETPEVEEKKEQNSTYWKYAFVDYMRDPDFRNLFDIEKEVEIEDSNYKSKKSKIEYNLGVNEIVVVDPVYVSIDERSKNPVEYEAAESARLELKDKIFTSAEKLDLKVEYVDHNGIAPNDAETFNDLALLNRWISEKLDHLDEDVDMINTTNDEFAELATKYNIDNFAWMGIIAFREREKYIGGKIVLCLFYPAAPFLIYDMIKPNFNTFYFTLVVNSKTGLVEMQYFNKTKVNDNESSQNSNIYYMLQQIKTKHKK
mgnify:CR=1 FL=1